MREEAFQAAGMFVAIVIVAALVNRFRPAHRFQVRRVVILFTLYLATHGIHYALEALGEVAWASRINVLAELIQAFTIVNLAATAFLSVFLPTTGVVLPMIASDLLVGLGYIVATLGVLSANGVNPTGAVASAAVVSAALVISLQSTLGNILGGVALQLDGSIHEGDWVQLENGKQGKIRAIRWRHTVVETRDWSTIIVPNAQLLSSNITILGKRDGKVVPQRMWVWFNVDFRFAPTRVIQVVTDALQASPIAGVSPEPAPNCVCMDFTRDMRESFATYAVRYWLVDLAHDDPTNSRVRARIYTALQRAHIPLALPARRTWVQMDDAASAQRRDERLRGERYQALRSIALFRSLTDEEVEKLAAGLSHVIYTAGETVTRQGAVAHWLYILTAGTVEIRATIDPDGPEGPEAARSTVVSKLTGPDVCGEMGLMTGEPRTADVVAITDVDCLRLDKATFQEVLLARPEIAHELSATLAKRRVGLVAAAGREHLDDATRSAREAKERDRIRQAILSFFAL